MNQKPDIRNKILEFPDLKRILDEEKSEGKKIAFTNGCFDILHAGHIHLLSEAASLGDILVLGLNADASVARLKGPNRPVNDTNSRAMLLASLLFVDYVIVFEEDTPKNLIEKIRPDVLIKGGDYSKDEIVGNEIVTAHGGKTVTIPLLEGFSTTELLRKSRKK